ncbi:MAG: exported protein of unknown function [Candidatus Saccharibacteria bacterium]|nr:exported protein of unknown function [Candidatus Saccharibacteria bacterium]
MRYFFGFLITIGLIILAFVLIINLTGRGSDTSTVQSGQQSVLTSYANTTKTTRLTVDGIINADELHRQVQISVGQNQAVMNVIGGYNGNVIKFQSYENNQNSYSEFLYGLQAAGFNRGDPDPKKSNESGACPTGRRISFDVYDGNQRLQHYWTTTCGGGTFKGNLDAVLALFQRQIPDYDTLTRDVVY